MDVDNEALRREARRLIKVLVVSDEAVSEWEERTVAGGVVLPRVIGRVYLLMPNRKLEPHDLHILENVIRCLMTVWSKRKKSKRKKNKRNQTNKEMISQISARD